VWVGQWVLLRGHVRGAGWWVLLSVFFGSVGGVMGTVFGGEVQDAVDGVPSSPAGIASVGPGRTYLGYYIGKAVAGSILGVTLGFGQWLLLRRTFRRAGWWILAKVISGTAGSLLDALLPVIGVISGFALKWLSKMTYPETLTTAAPEPRVSVGWGFCLQWVWLTALGFGAGSEIFNAIARPMPESVRDVIGWGVGGACVGAVQWVLLQRQFAAASWWVLASAVGWVVGALLFVPGGASLSALATVLTGGHKGFLVGPNSGAVVGASVGVMQWFLLRREVTTAGWWVPACALGWAVAYIAPWTGPASPGPATALGMITGSLTSIVLVWLLRRPKREIQKRTVE